MCKYMSAAYKEINIIVAPKNVRVQQSGSRRAAEKARNTELKQKVICCVLTCPQVHHIMYDNVNILSRCRPFASGNRDSPPARAEILDDCM